MKYFKYDNLFPRYRQRFIDIGLIIIFLSVIIFENCYAKDFLKHNNLNLTHSTRAYFPVKPIKKDIIKRNRFDSSKIYKDWVPLKKILVIDKLKLEDEFKREKHVMESQPNRTKYSAWEMGPMLHKYLNAFLITKDETYLNKFLEHYDYFYSVRMDQKGRINFNGELLPQWERLDRYNIFTVSPYFEYSIKDKETIMLERDWQSLYFSDINYSGLILEPILRFIQIIKHSKLEKFEKKADEILVDSLKVINSHNSDWVNLHSDTTISKKNNQFNIGYYKFPYNSPFYLDNVEMPVNEAAIFGSALVRAYMLTNSEFYLERAIAMFNRWKAFITKDHHRYIAYPYFTGKGFDGWDERDQISKNTPIFKSQKKYESFHKTALTIDFLILLNQVKPGMTTQYLEEFYWVLLASMDSSQLTSQFPGRLGFGYPYNTYHAILPYNSKGWLHLATQNFKFKKNTINQITRKKNHNLSNVLYLQFLTETDIGDFANKMTSVNVSPLYLDEKKNKSYSNCLWKPPISGMVNISFAHHTPKNNRIYLYDPENNKMKIRLEVNKGKFYGTIFVKKNECIDLRWKRSPTGAPNTSKENVIKFLYIK